MLAASTLLAKNCKELVDLESILGYFPILDQPLDFNYDDEVEKPPSSPVSSSLSSSGSNPSKLRLAMLNYDEYNRDNQLKQITALSQTDTKSNDALAEKDLTSQTKFLAELDILVRALVESVSAVKKAHAQHFKDEFMMVVSTVAAGTQAILSEIKNYEPFAESSDVVLNLEIDDLDIIESKAGALGYEDDDIPIPYKQVLATLQQEIYTATRLVIYKGKIASGATPHPAAATEMIQATIPCLVGVKKIVTVAKEGAIKWAKTFVFELIL
jgi:hypothetical protein